MVTKLLSSDGSGIQVSPGSGQSLEVTNGTVLLNDGSKTTPAIRFSDDTNTGLYSPINDVVAVAGQGEDIVQFIGVSSSVNYLTITPSITNESVNISSDGADPNINLSLSGKGTGDVIIGPAGLDGVIQAESNQQLTIAGGDSNGANAGNLLIRGGNGNGSFASGNILLTPGTGGLSDGTVILGTTGNAIITTDPGDNLTVKSGDSDGLVNSGNTIITGGNGSGSFASGDVIITPGIGGSSDGVVVIDGLVWPVFDGTFGQVLTTDGSGNLTLQNTEISLDATPQLGGNLDVNGFQINSTSNTDVVLNPNGSGRIEFGGIFYSKRQTTTLLDAQTNTVFFTYTAATNEATFIDYGLRRATIGSKTGTLTIINDGITAALTDINTEIDLSGVTFDAVINGASVEVRYTSTADGHNADMAFSVRQWNV